MKGRTSWIIAVALAVGAFAAGCGGSDPKEEYIADGDEICALGTFQIGSEAQSRYGSPQPPPKEAERFARQVIVPTLQSQVVEALRSLTPPEGDEQTVAAIYNALEQAIDELRADPALINDPNVGGEFDEANRLAKAYGFKQCGSN